MNIKKMVVISTRSYNMFAWYMEKLEKSLSATAYLAEVAKRVKTDSDIDKEMMDDCVYQIARTLISMMHVTAGEDAVTNDELREEANLILKKDVRGFDEIKKHFDQFTSDTDTPGIAEEYIKAIRCKNCVRAISLEEAVGEPIGEEQKKKYRWCTALKLGVEVDDFCSHGTTK